MRKLFFVSIALPMVMLFLACGGRTKAEAEADSLKNVLGAQLAEMTEMDLFIDAVNANMDSVMRLEGIILRTHGESKLSRKDQILQNIDTYREVLDRQRLRLAELEKKLKETDNQNEKLQKTVDALKNQIDEKEEVLQELIAEMEQHNFDINALKARMEKLNSQVTSLQKASKEKDETIEAQGERLNEAYVFIGTKKELKEAGLLSDAGFLKKGKLDMTKADASAFTRIDLRSTTTFRIPDKKPEILSTVPEGSYTLTRNDDGSSTLTVTDPAKFWSLSKYLVIKY